MYQTKSLKNYVQPISLAILIALLLCNCRSASHHSSVRVSEQTDSVSVRLSSKAHGSITSQTQTQTDINGNKWKITWHFDTSKPADPTTRKQIQDPRTNTLNRRAKSKQSPEQVLKEV